MNSKKKINEKNPRVLIIHSGTFKLPSINKTMKIPVIAMIMAKKPLKKKSTAAK